MEVIRLDEDTVLKTAGVTNAWGFESLDFRYTANGPVFQRLRIPVLQTGDIGSIPIWTTQRFEILERVWFSCSGILRA